MSSGAAFRAIQARCDEQGTSTLHFTATGTASGPYPGTFTETVDATMGPQTQAFGGLYGGLGIDLGALT